MIVKLFPTQADFNNLSRLTTVTSEHANQFDYSNVVVTKPWGYEYLWFQNASVSAWMLRLLPGQSTSLHCHIRKRTSLVVVAGEVVCSTLTDRYKMSSLDAVVLEPCVFHTTQAVAKDGAWVLEIETPPLKGDLIRLKDAFGRENIGYESQTQYSRDLKNFDYRPFLEPHQSLLFQNTEFCLRSVQSYAELASAINTFSLCVPVLGRFANKDESCAEIGEAFDGKIVNKAALAEKFPPVDILGLRRQQK